MNITLKSLKIAKFLSQETTAFSATIYIDGRKAGTADNDGNGGPNRYHFDAFDGKKGYEIEQELQAWAATLPKMQVYDTELSMDLDLVIDGIIQKMEYDKQVARSCKKKTLFLLEGDDPEVGWRTVKAPYDARVQAFLDNKYGAKVVRILNKEIA